MKVTVVVKDGKIEVPFSVVYGDTLREHIYEVSADCGFGGRSFDELIALGDGEHAIVVDEAKLSVMKPFLPVLLKQDKRNQNLHWNEPDLKTNKNDREIKRSSKELADLGCNIDPDDLKDVLQQGELQKLNGHIWKRIVNTDSLNVRKMRDIIRVVHDKGKKLRNVIEEYIADQLTAPILAQMPDKRYYLVNGNTRLMVAHLFRDVVGKPMVWVGTIPDQYKMVVNWEGKNAA